MRSVVAGAGGWAGSARGHVGRAPPLMTRRQRRHTDRSPSFRPSERPVGVSPADRTINHTSTGDREVVAVEPRPVKEKRSKLNCRQCGESVPEERIDAGYDYCVKPACVEACLRPLNVVAIAVNKSNDQLALREQLDIPAIVSRTRTDGGQYGAAHRPPTREPRVLTDGQRIARMREVLEARLEACQDPVERARLIDTYNARVRRMNIRFRRMGLYSQSDPRRVRS